MSFPIWVHQENGHFRASLLGSPDLCVTAPTRETALAQMHTLLQDRYRSGELVMMNVQPDLMDLAGKYKDDETLTEICEEIYRQRDAERPTE